MLGCVVFIGQSEKKHKPNILVVENIRLCSFHWPISKSKNATFQWLEDIRLCDFHWPISKKPKNLIFPCLENIRLCGLKKF